MVSDKIATTCGITSAALHMYRITGNSPLDANNGRRSSRRIDVTKHLAGNPMSDKKTNKRLSEDHPNLGVNISQRASGNSLKLITQTKISECLSVPFNGIWFGNLIEEKQMGFEMLSKLVVFLSVKRKFPLPAQKMAGISVRKDTENGPYQSIRCTNASSEFAKEASPLIKTASENLNSPKDDSYVGPLLSCCARRLAA